MARILFVDDDARVLQGLKRMLYPLRNEWEMFFCDSGKKALEVLSSHPFDIIISDMRMPEMDGAELLSHVQKEHPDIVRIVLSGHSDQELIMRSVGPAHQYLVKPCDPETLKGVVRTALSLRDTLTNDSLKKLATEINHLPTLPSLYMELMETLSSPESSISRVAEIIGKDIGMTTKILQLVNSAFFGLGRHVSDPKQAVSLLGLDTVTSLALSIGVFEQFDAISPELLEDLWSHSMKTASLARAICRSEKAPKTVREDAFLGGTLHDIGKLILALNKPEEYRESVLLAPLREITASEAEREIFGVTHSEVGGYLLSIWGFAHPIVEAVAFHHRPSECDVAGLSPLVAVHVADALHFESKQANDGDVFPEIDEELLKRAGLLGRIDLWRSLRDESAGKEESDE